MGSRKSNIGFNVALFFLAFVLTFVIFMIDVNVPMVLDVAAMYCVVIFYSWVLPGRLTSIYVAILCTVLVVVAAVKAPVPEVESNYYGLNAVISIIVIWVSTSLVSIARFSVGSLEEALSTTQTQIEQRTKQLVEIQKDLLKNQKQYLSLLESAPDATIVVNENAEIILANKQVEAIFGYSSEELMRKPVEMLIPEGARDHHSDYFKHYLSNIQFRSMGDGRYLRGLKKDGSTFPVEISLSPTELEDEILISASIRDISARALAEDRQRKYTKRLKDKNRELEQFVYIASHDLQEPLRTMSSFVTRLNKEIDNALEGKAAQYLSFISESSERMSSLVSCLLDYGRLGKNSEVVMIDLNVLLADILSDLRSVIESAGADVNVRSLPTLYGMETELRCLFQNLLSNAIKFRHADRQPEVTVECEVIEPGKWQFTVSDNGIGIAPQHHDKIFMIFQRLNSASNYEGMGIGLAHCRKIVELHDGKIWVESEFGAGSSFKFTLNSLENKSEQ